MESWTTMAGRYGDWGRDAALWLGRRIGRLRLSELAERAGGIDYAAAGTAVARFGKRLDRDAALKKVMDRIGKQMSNDQI